MKKWMKICLIIICVLLVFEFFAWVFGFRINPFAVEKAVLCSYEYESDEYHTVELTKSQILKISLLYNYCSFPLGKIMADPPPMADRVEFHFATGRKIMMDTLRGERLLMKPGYYSYANAWLWNYIQDLLEKYDLPAW